MGSWIAVVAQSYTQEPADVAANAAGRVRLCRLPDVNSNPISHLCSRDNSLSYHYGELLARSGWVALDTT
jgi:hypothetical protein